jgi:SAM-dependent methyltransferase
MMTQEDLLRANEETRQAWNENAAFWDARMGEGNDFVEVLTWPATERLMELRAGECVLDIACGNGLTSRRLAAMGAEVVAFDFAEELIARARHRTREAASPEGAGQILYHVLDATNEATLLALGEGRFDAALCHMALFDMAEIDPLMRALSRLLRVGAFCLFGDPPLLQQPTHGPRRRDGRPGGRRCHYVLGQDFWLHDACRIAWLGHRRPAEATALLPPASADVARCWS